jgi:hypothetical protein
MILSHKYRFIHVRAAKVGSTSVEQTLSKVCGERDVVSTALEYSPKEDEENFIDRARNDKGFEPHQSPVKLREAVGEDVWNTYFKVVGVRNPWDMLCSYYEWERRSWMPGRTTMDFSEWARKTLIDGTPQVGIPNKGYWLDEGKPVVDMFLRHESLDEDFAKFCQEVGVRPVRLMRLKTKVRQERDWRVYYKGDQELVKLVETVYGPEIEYFGYEFER